MMASLAFNAEISQRLKSKPMFALGALPVGLMFAAFIPLFAFQSWLAATLGIPENTPVKDQANGFWWISLFIIMMIGLMVAGYLLGWLLNAVIARMFLHWPQEKVINVYLHSEVPSSWLRPGTSQPYQQWQKIRKKGRWHFIFYRGLLSWGLPMYFIMVLLPVIRGKGDDTSFVYFGSTALIWAAAGFFFGWGIWFCSEKGFLKSRDKPN